jgi:hypothetical protein
VLIGLSNAHQKLHRFDLGNIEVLVECKKYNWTTSGNVPSAKLATLNEAMLYFIAAPTTYRKILFLAKTLTPFLGRTETLCDYYVRQYRHLLPDDVDIYEFDEGHSTASKKIGPNPVL